jgi:hypothetical protein
MEDPWWGGGFLTICVERSASTALLWTHLLPRSDSAKRFAFLSHSVIPAKKTLSTYKGKGEAENEKHTQLLCTTCGNQIILIPGSKEITRAYLCINVYAFSNIVFYFKLSLLHIFFSCKQSASCPFRSTIKNRNHSETTMLWILAVNIKRVGVGIYHKVTCGTIAIYIHPYMCVFIYLSIYLYIYIYAVIQLKASHLWIIHKFQQDLRAQVQRPSCLSSIVSPVSSTMPDTQEVLKRCVQLKSGWLIQ